MVVLVNKRKEAKYQGQVKRGIVFCGDGVRNPIKNKREISTSNGMVLGFALFAQWFVVFGSATRKFESISWTLKLFLISIWPL